MSDLTYTAFKEAYLSMISPSLPGFANHFARFSADATVENLFTVTDKLIDNAKKFNLTSIVEPAEIIRKHLIDSLIPLGLILDEKIPLKTVLDVGSGAGFPLLPWACALDGEDTGLYGLDATRKKIDHILETRDAARLYCVEALQGRAEELAFSSMRESFSLVTARAVADLPVLMELCAPFVKKGGYFAALKGHAEQELESAGKAAKILGLGEPKVISYTIPGGDGRTLLLYKKEKATPLTHPRRYSEITKKPL